jgi:hypothetical protein
MLHSTVLDSTDQIAPLLGGVEAAAPVGGDPNLGSGGRGLSLAEPGLS